MYFTKEEKGTYRRAPALLCSLYVAAQYFSSLYSTKATLNRSSMKVLIQDKHDVHPRVIKIVHFEEVYEDRVFNEGQGQEQGIDTLISTLKKVDVVGEGDEISISLSNFHLGLAEMRELQIYKGDIGREKQRIEEGCTELKKGKAVEE
ncbi:hypothetical protein FNV43_RR02367 [Rhamnella rubrinervis]|uniref:Uncharacterized protein n=1 Tax=Rhamnella rubrinervis TaxID=2594499 RepID=A0A8K0HTM9_9ROSA|nr:hypothetical protein FNV43_RR02367 [Rhamnella rubrinervis]